MLNRVLVLPKLKWQCAFVKTQLEYMCSIEMKLPDAEPVSCSIFGQCWETSGQLLTVFLIYNSFYDHHSGNTANWISDCSTTLNYVWIQRAIYKLNESMIWLCSIPWTPLQLSGLNAARLSSYDQTYNFRACDIFFHPCLNCPEENN